MKIKCVKCGEVFDIPKGDCPICFSEHLAEISEISNEDERFEKLSDFVNELCAFDYQRGQHNAKCENQLCEGNFVGLDFVEVEEEKHQSIADMMYDNYLSGGLD